MGHSQWTENMLRNLVEYSGTRGRAPTENQEPGHMRTLSTLNMEQNNAMYIWMSDTKFIDYWSIDLSLTYWDDERDRHLNVLHLNVCVCLYVTNTLLNG